MRFPAMISTDLLKTATRLRLPRSKAVADDRCHTARKYKPAKMPPDEQEWIRKVREEVRPPPTPTTTCERS